MRALEACASQHVGSASVEIVVVDNSSSHFQRWLLDTALWKSIADRARLVPEPRSGLSYARNMGIAAARGEIVAFCDDDEAPKSRWLEAHITALAAASGDASFGPVLPVFEDGGPVHAFAAQLYTRGLAVPALSEVGAKFNYLTSANFCIRKSASSILGAEPFDLRFNHTGGEDTDFFRRLHAAGKKLVWVPDAIMNEYVPLARTTVVAMSMRRFGQGQIRTFAHLASNPRRYDKAAFFITAGAVQFAGHSMLRFANVMRGTKEIANTHRIKAQGGLGKVLWWSRFRRKQYVAGAK